MCARACSPSLSFASSSWHQCIVPHIFYRAVVISTQWYYSKQIEQVHDQHLKGEREEEKTIEYFLIMNSSASLQNLINSQYSSPKHFAFNSSIFVNSKNNIPGKWLFYRKDIGNCRRRRKKNLHVERDVRWDWNPHGIENRNDVISLVHCQIENDRSR